MKKFLAVLLIGFCAILTAKAEVEFTYEAGAELVSSYLWRGQYNGGLSLQPDLEVGYEGEHTSFSIGAWASVGASDWGFRKGKEMNLDGSDPNTYFVPEVDIIGSFTFFNVTIGFTHYYYCDGGNFLGWKKAVDWDSEDWSSSTTEVQIGYNFADLLPENHNLYFNWYTMVAGNDFKYDELGDITGNNYSSHLELGYDYTFDNIGLTLGTQIGFVPWSSDYYGNDGFAVQNVSLRLGKEWEFDHCSLELYGMGMVNPSGLNADHETVFIKASGDDKIGCQTLNGTIGLGLWF